MLKDMVYLDEDGSSELHRVKRLVIDIYCSTASANMGLTLVDGNINRNVLMM